MNNDYLKFDSVPGMFDDCYNESVNDQGDYDSYTEDYEQITGYHYRQVPVDMKTEVLFPMIVNKYNQDIPIMKDQVYKAFMSQYRIKNTREVDELRNAVNKSVYLLDSGTDPGTVTMQLRLRLKDLYKGWSDKDTYYKSLSPKLSFDSVIKLSVNKVMDYSRQLQAKTITSAYRRGSY